MDETSGATFWLWPNPQKLLADEVLNRISENGYPKEKIVLLHCTNVPVVDYGVSLNSYLINLFHSYNLLQSNRTTLFSYKDHILALQLCLARLQQKNEEEFDALNSDVIACHKTYIAQCQQTNEAPVSDQQCTAIELYTEFLKHSNCTDMWQIYMLLKNTETNENFKNKVSNSSFVVFGVPQLGIHRDILKFLAVGKMVKEIEIPLDVTLQERLPIDSIHISSQTSLLEDVFILKSRKLDQHFSATMEYAEDIFVAFLTLLVNSRNELALCRAMVSPLVDVTHSAFTELKRVAIQKEMPMYQTAISYITRIKLGGKGYAPPEDCPLHSHFKGLEQFVELLNQLQTVIEEDRVTESAVKRVINILKNRLLKYKGNNLKQTSIEDAAKRLSDIAVNLIKQRKMEVEPVKDNARLEQEALDIFCQVVDFANCSGSATDPEAILDEKHIQRTPLNMPPLLGYFRSPEEDSVSSISSIHSEFISNNTEDDKGKLLDYPESTISYVHSCDSNSVSKSCVGASTPTKTTFKDCFERKNFVEPKKFGNRTLNSDGIKPPAKPKIGKRSILQDISNANTCKKAANPSKKAKTTNRSRAKQQIKGQAQITNFFAFHA